MAIITGTGGNDILPGTENNDQISGLAGNDSIYGRGGDDELWGGGGDDTLKGGTDNDTLDGGDGSDELHGQAGYDSLYGGAGNDSVHGGEGDDTVRFLGNAEGYTWGMEDDNSFQISGPDGTDSLTGIEALVFDDIIKSVFIGTDADDTLTGTDNNDEIYGLAGLRLGYAMAHPDRIEQMRRAKQAFNVNLLAQKAGAEALKDEEFIQKTLDLCAKGKSYLYEALKEAGFFFYPSEANFLCIRTERNSLDVFNDLLDRGMAIRPLASFGMPRWIRFTIGTQEQNWEFIRLLKAFGK